jgi:hypothetical protein
LRWCTKTIRRFEIPCDRLVWGYIGRFHAEGTITGGFTKKLIRVESPPQEADLARPKGEIDMAKPKITFAATAAKLAKTKFDTSSYITLTPISTLSGTLSSSHGAPQRTPPVNSERPKGKGPKIIA